MHKKHITLLRKLSSSRELMDLINYTIIEDQEIRESYYMEHGAYPQQRDLLGLLKCQLIVTKETLEIKKEEK